MLDVGQALRDIASFSNRIDTNKNKYYIARNTVANTYGKIISLCSVSVPVGEYLILGNVDTNKDATTTLAAFITSGTGSERIMIGDGRSVMNAGGGCQAWAIIKATSETTVTLQTYGYYSGSCNFNGRLCAIKLIT